MNRNLSFWAPCLGALVLALLMFMGVVQVRESALFLGALFGLALVAEIFC
jgi:hypothetical protein